MPQPQRLTGNRKQDMPRIVALLERYGFLVETRLCQDKRTTLYTVTRGNDFYIASVTASLVSALAYCIELGKELSEKPLC